MNTEGVWEFSYWSRKKQRAIQFKPHHDATNHFTILRVDKKLFSQEDYVAVDTRVREYIKSHGDKLVFIIYRVCKNCTYGRFEPDFEQLILDIRKTYPGVLHTKDLPLGDERHAEIVDLVLWDKDHPIIHHVHWRSENKDWEKLATGSFGSKITLVFKE